MLSGPADEAAISGPDARDATAPTTATTHFACLEGIRALAAGLVVLHHAASFVGAGRAGLLNTPAAVMDIGVSIFFVLSGFLIYRPFTKAHFAATKPLRARTFWWRRVVRIVPAYWLALTVFWVAGFFSLGHDYWRYYLFLQIYSPFTSFGGIVPAWSLDTEMVFYLVIPFWSLFLRRVVHRGKPARPAVELGAVALFGLAGYVSRFWLGHHDVVWAHVTGHPPVYRSNVAFTWFPTNMDLFAAGMAVSALAVWATQDEALNRRLRSVTGTAGPWWAAAVALFAWFAYRVGGPPGGNYVGWYWQQRQLVFGLIGVCLLVPAVFGDQQRGWLRRTLQWRPIAWMGVTSYGLYLWHLNLMEELPDWIHRVPTSIPVLVAIAVAFAWGTGAAALSWYLWERPIQRFAKRLL